jgi:hypothetical protein
MYTAAIFIGGFVHWIYKCCKGTLKEEILHGNDAVNYLIGLVSVIMILGTIIWIIF